jgi:hypothetical protein
MIMKKGPMFVAGKKIYTGFGGKTKGRLLFEPAFREE